MAAVAAPPVVTLGKDAGPLDARISRWVCTPLWMKPARALANLLTVTAGGARCRGGGGCTGHHQPRRRAAHYAGASALAGAAGLPSLQERRYGADAGSCHGAVQPDVLRIFSPPCEWMALQ